MYCDRFLLHGRSQNRQIIRWITSGHCRFLIEFKGEPYQLRKKTLLFLVPNQSKSVFQLLNSIYCVILHAWTVQQQICWTWTILAKVLAARTSKMFLRFLACAVSGKMIGDVQTWGFKSHMPMRGNKFQPEKKSENDIYSMGRRATFKPWCSQILSWVGLKTTGNSLIQRFYWQLHHDFPAGLMAM